MSTVIKSVMVMCFFMMAACSNAAEYQGKWQNVNKKEVFELEANGNDFVLKQKSNNWFTGKPEVNKIPMQRDGDSLKASNGLISVTFSYVKATDTLVSVSSFGSAEYKRIK